MGDDDLRGLSGGLFPRGALVLHSLIILLFRAVDFIIYSIAYSSAFIACILAVS